MQLQLNVTRLLPLIIKMKKFKWCPNLNCYPDKATENVEKLEEIVGREMHYYEILDLLPKSKLIYEDAFSIPLWSYDFLDGKIEVYEFEYNGKKYYAVEEEWYSLDDRINEFIITIVDNENELINIVKNFYKRAIKYAESYLEYHKEEYKEHPYLKDIPQIIKEIKDLIKKLRQNLALAH